MSGTLVLAGILVIAGALAVTASEDRAILVGLSIHSIAMALMAVASAGPVLTGAIFIGNATAVAVMGLGYLYAVDSQEETPVAMPGARRRRKMRRYVPGPRRSSNTFLQGLSALLAVVIALGLANKPIAGLSEASVGVPSFIAYWMLAAGLVIIMLSREHLKVGAGLLLMLNGGQVMYLLSARILEARLVAASVLIVLAVALGVSYLVVVGTKLRMPPEQEQAMEHSIDLKQSEPATPTALGDDSC